VVAQLAQVAKLIEMVAEKAGQFVTEDAF